VPGTPGQGVPVGGTAGQFLTKIDGTNYNTDWTTVNLSAYAVKANNLSDLTNFSLARDNLNLGTLNNPTFAGLTLQGSGANVGQYTPTSLSLTHTTFGSFVISPSSGITFPDTSVQTTAFPAGSDLPTGGMTGQVLTKSSNANYDADWATLSLAGYATEAWVTAGFYPLTGNPSSFLTASALSPYLTSATAASTYQTLAGMSSYLTTSAAAAGYYPLSGNPSGFLTSASLSGYATESWVTAGFAPLARGLPAGGEDGQIIVKDGTVDYATIWTDNSAETLTVRATNKTGSTLNKGAVVRINGAQGQRPTIALAQANSGASADGVIGILLATLANNATGLVCTAGLAKRLDTSAYTEGVKLFLSPSVAGGLTPTRPSAPDHAVAVGIVSHSSATTGSIEVNVVVGDHLEWLHDVLITTPTNGQVLKYDSATSLWVNGTDVGGVAWGGITGTLSSQTDLQTALDGKYSTSNPSGFITSAALTGYATESFVTSQGYITASALAGYATESWVTSQGYLTSAALTGYATESWVTAGFYPLTGNPSSFLVAADIAGKANIASPSLTGTPLSTTAAVDTNTTQIATTAFVVGQAGSATPLVNGTAAVGTSLRYARQDHVHPTDTSRMALNPSSITMGATGGTINIPIGGIYTTGLSVWNQGIRIFDGVGATVGAFKNDEVLIPSVGITFSDATTQTSAGLTASDAASTYQTIAGMSSYAPLASPALTGNVTITSNSTGAALFVTQTGTGNILTLHDQASDTTFVAIDQNGKVNTIASTTTNAGFNVPHGTAPSAPVNGDVWTTTGGLFYRINGATISPATLAGGTFTGKITTVASTTATAGFRLPSGTAPTSPTQGDIWTVSGANGSIVFQGNGTQTVATLGYSQTFSGNNTFSGATSTFGNSTATGTINVASGATISGSTKAVNVGTGGASGSTTTVNIGSAVSGATSTINLNGTVNAPGLANGVKAWANFNGTGTVAIRASANVSSITDNGVGDYTMNFTTALADANYAAAGFAGDAAFSIAVTTSSWGTYTQTTSAFRFKVSYGSTTIDTTNVHMTIIR
jgi:hypothetical protein